MFKVNYAYSGRSVNQDTVHAYASRLGARVSVDEIIASEEKYKDFSSALQLYNTLNDCTDTYIEKDIKVALDVMSGAIRLFGPEYIFSSYNGGKDAAIIMHLFRATMAKHNFDHRTSHRPKFVYFSQPDEFTEVLHEIETAEMDYSLDIFKYENISITKGLEYHIKDMTNDSRPVAFVLGTRKGDPNCGEQEHFTPSSPWMPSFMRVNPILHWDYGKVWYFLRKFNLSYCCLYDNGYTSLGKTTDTIRNPALLLSNGEYSPAYMLADFALERAGRKKNI